MSVGNIIYSINSKVITSGCLNNTLSLMMQFLAIVLISINKGSTLLLVSPFALL